MKEFYCAKNSQNSLNCEWLLMRESQSATLNHGAVSYIYMKNCYGRQNFELEIYFD